MVKINSIISRLGSKTNEIKYIKEYFPDFLIVVEPFAGTFALSKYIYSLHGFSKKYHINDNDDNLFYIDEYEKELNNFYKFFDGISNYDRKNKINDFKYTDDIFKKEIIKRCVIKNNIVRTNKTQHDDKPTKQILKNSLLTNANYLDILEKYKDNQDAFLFLDPPYLFSNNSGYQKQCGDKKDMDNTDMIFDIKEFMIHCKCKVMLVINDLKIIRLMFTNMIKKEYDVTYMIGKKKGKHLIICNYE